jgi:hypothetical protein
MKRFFILFAICVFSVTASPQETRLQEAVQVNLVDLYFTATTGKGHFINDLREDEITVSEDGVPQHIEHFGAFAGERNEIPVEQENSTLRGMQGWPYCRTSGHWIERCFRNSVIP